MAEILYLSSLSFNGTLFCIIIQPKKSGFRSLMRGKLDYFGMLCKNSIIKSNELILINENQNLLYKNIFKILN